MSSKKPGEDGNGNESAGAEESKDLTRRERAALAAENDALNRAAASLAVVPLTVHATETDATDEERGYTERHLSSGVDDFMSLHDQWTNPDESLVRAHVADYRARRDGMVTG